jgi:hypothetical protein
MGKNSRQLAASLLTINGVIKRKGIRSKPLNQGYVRRRFEMVAVSIG